MKLGEIGQAATTSGWRSKAADVVAPRLGRSPVPLSEQQARALLGLLFLTLSIRYVLRTLRDARR